MNGQRQRFSYWRRGELCSLSSWSTLRCLLFAGVFAFSHVQAAPEAKLVDDLDHNSFFSDKPATAIYARQVGTLIEKAWEHAVEQRDDLTQGKVVVHASIDCRGDVFDPTVVSGSPDKSSRQLALQAIKSTSLPTMPLRAFEELKGQRLLIDVTFNLYDMPQKSSHTSRSSVIHSRSR